MRGGLDWRRVENGEDGLGAQEAGTGRLWEVRLAKALVSDE